LVGGVVLILYRLACFVLDELESVADTVILPLVVITDAAVCPYRRLSVTS